MTKQDMPNEIWARRIAHTIEASDADIYNMTKYIRADLCVQAETECDGGSVIDGRDFHWLDGPKPIEGLGEAIDIWECNKQKLGFIECPIIKAAKAYLELTEGEK